MPPDAGPGEELLVKVEWDGVDSEDSDFDADDLGGPKIGWVTPDRQKIAEEMLRRDPPKVGTKECALI